MIEDDMFINNIDPVLLSLGPFEVRYYGIVYVIGFLWAYILLYTKRKELGADEDQINSFMIHLMLGLIVGARLLHFLIDNPYRLQGHSTWG